MATRIYLHNASSTVSGTLPSTKQSAQSISSGSGSQSVNKTMTTTIGTSQATTAASSDASNYTYFTRFVSEVLPAGSVSANTWTINFAFRDPFSSGSYGTRVCIYVWRPSTGARIGFIADVVASLSGSPSSNEVSVNTTVSGSAVTAAAGDVLCFEAMAVTFSFGSWNYYYDGTTVTTTTDTIVSNHASFIETPQTIALGAPADIDMTANSTTLQNKFITKV